MVLTLQPYARFLASTFRVFERWNQPGNEERTRIRLEFGVLVLSLELLVLALEFGVFKARDFERVRKKDK